jgi:hypothetical protein
MPRSTFAVALRSSAPLTSKEGKIAVGVHDIVITEPHPCRRGFFRRLYARIQTSNTGEYWVWRQIDENGLPLTDAERAFESEDAALNDAVRSLNGVAVAV